nr:MAG TPA: hypothetical protein [Caudoviricetes sp.]
MYLHIEDQYQAHSKLYQNYLITVLIVHHQLLNNLLNQYDFQN